MSNAIYPIYKQAALTTGATNVGMDQNTTTDGPFVALIDTGTYTYSALHDFYNDLTGIVGTDQRIASPTVVNGTFDGADVTFSAVTGPTVEALVIYRKNSGANTTWRLTSYIDTSVTGLPVTPNGGDITITWNASGIFTISDRRLKENVRLVGDHAGVLGIYEYNYIGEERVRLGLMAQEVEKIVPAAVIDLGSHKRVDYHAALAGADRLAA